MISRSQRRFSESAATLFLLSAVLAAAESGAATKLSGAERKEAERIAKEYWSATGDGARVRCLRDLAAIDHPSERDVLNLAEKCLVWMRTGARIEAKNKETCTDPEYPGEYLITVPSKARKGKPVGVFISLHGGGEGIGSGEQIQGMFGQPGKSMINVFPTVIERTDTAWNNEREERYVLAILEDLKRNFNIDTNRVYLAGHSMGGFGTWSIGAKHADRFAAISPQAGGVFWEGSGLARGTVANLHNLPIWFYHSTDDPRVKDTTDQMAAKALAELAQEYEGGYEHEWKEYTDIGHGTPKEGLQPIWDWMMERERNPLPKRIVWEPVREWKSHFYWIAKSKASSGRIVASRDGNRFTVSGAHAGLAIYLNADMVDFDQPIQVVDDAGKVLHEAPAAPSLVAMLESLSAHRDQHLLFTSVVRLGE